MATYLARLMQPMRLWVTWLGGLPVGNAVANADDVAAGRAFYGRRPIEG